MREKWFVAGAALVVCGAVCLVAADGPVRSRHTPWMDADARVLADGAVPPATENGSFVLGSEHPAASQTIVQPGIPRGSVTTFEMSSAHSRYYPGIARTPGTFGAPDPHDPRKLLVPTSHSAPWTRSVTVYVPKQYVSGTAAPFIVGADGPDPLLFKTLDALIAEHRVPAMIAISIQNGGGDAQGSGARP